MMGFWASTRQTSRPEDKGTRAVIPLTRNAETTTDLQRDSAGNVSVVLHMTRKTPLAIY